MLKIENLVGGYTKANTLHNVSLSVQAGQVVSLLGANGAGKTTTLRAISGMLPRAEGLVELEGHSLLPLGSHKRAGLGLAHVPEGRRVFPSLSVRDNLSLGSWSLAKEDSAQLDRVVSLFPRLKERFTQRAGTLSGGEQQMLAIGRALMSKPKILVLDEPSMGLSPKLVDEVFATLALLKSEGMTMLIVEQFAKRALALSDYAYVLQRGSVALSGIAQDLLKDEAVHRIYLS